MMTTSMRLFTVLVTTLLLMSGCSILPLSDGNRAGNYLVIVDLPDVSIAKVGYKGSTPEVRTIANGDWGVSGIVGSGIEQVISERVKGEALYADDKEITDRLSYEKMLVMRKLDADDAEFIREKYASDSIDFLVLVTKYRYGMSEFYGAGMRQKDIPMPDFHCQFFTALQLEVYELSTGKILSTVTESQREDCPVKKYFDDVNNIADKELGDIRQGVQHVAAKAANRVARHLLMTDTEKEEFKIRLPGFE